MAVRGDALRHHSPRPSDGVENLPQGRAPATAIPGVAGLEPRAQQGSLGRVLTVAFLFAVTLTASISPGAPAARVARWERQARDVTIVRDDWGIAHVFGRSDADA